MSDQPIKEISAEDIFSALGIDIPFLLDCINFHIITTGSTPKQVDVPAPKFLFNGVTINLCGVREYITSGDDRAVHHLKGKQC